MVSFPTISNTFPTMSIGRCSIVHQQGILLTNMTKFTFTFCPFNPDANMSSLLSSVRKNCTRDKTSCTLVMDQNLEQQDSNRRPGDIQVRIIETENSHKCNLFDYASSYAGNLMRHLKTHSGEKSNKCNQCDFASSYASALRTHLKTHSGEKSFKCYQCDYACTDPSALRTHLKMHSGEKPNKCNLCDYASSYARDLRRHLKRHDGEK